jgi:hypothetical protein
VKEFCRPHQHIIDKEGYDVWTFAINPRNEPYWVRDSERRLRRDGRRVFIYNCAHDCEIYRPDGSGRLLTEETHGNIDRIRHPEGRLQDREERRVS